MLRHCFAVAYLVSSILSTPLNAATAPVSEEQVEDSQPRSTEPVSAHYELGTTMGTPAFFNLSAGYWSDHESFPYLVRVSGMYLLFAGGIQLDLGWQLYREKSLRQFVTLTGIGAGVVGNDGGGLILNAVGVQYGLRYGGFFFEVGPMLSSVSMDGGSTRDTYILPALQIGYTAFF